MKTVAFCTLGCKVNQYETEAMRAVFENAGYKTVSFQEKADVYVVNTCTVTGLSDRKSRQMMRRAKKLSPESVLAVTGCYAQVATDEVKGIEGVDLVLGNTDKLTLVEKIEAFQKNHMPSSFVKDIFKQKTFESMQVTRYLEHTRAYVKIQDGCNQFCTYCMIPYARGPIRSRKPEEVLEEVEALAQNGYTEIVLTGIHVASYGKDLEGETLLDLIKKVHQIEGISRIRMSSIEPMAMHEGFLSELAALPKVCPHFHLSLQSGSDGVLRRMNRRYTTEEYRNIISNIRSSIPEVSITTDIMVGFPGETDEEFNESLSFAREMAFSKMHVFPFSPRKGTRAAAMENQIPEDIKEKRSHEMLKLSDEMQEHYLERFIGKTVPVLLEQPVKNKPGFLEGYTDTYITVYVKAPEAFVGQMKEVKLQENHKTRILGTLCE